MRICVVGSGAVGGFMGVKMALTGHDVTFIDQGERLAAIQERGLKLVMNDGHEYSVEEVRAFGRCRDAGSQDMVILGLKAHHICEVAADLPYLFGPLTSVVSVQNGIPWWYFDKHGGEFEGRRLESLDPDGLIGEHVPSERIIGCVVYWAADVPKPGMIRQVEGDRFAIGELDGSHSQRCSTLSQVLTDAGYRCRILDDIRSEIWLKAWGTLSFNPISALTHATLVDICQFKETRKLAAVMMEEAQKIAHKLGIEFRRPIERRIAGAEAVGPHKTSMLQDVEAGLELELEALVGAVVELGRITHTPTPAIDAVYACTKLLNKTYREAGIYFPPIARTTDVL